MEVVVTTGDIRCIKLQSNHHHQQTNTQLFTGQMPFLSLNQQHRRTDGKILVDNCSFDLCKADHLLNVTAFTTSRQI